MILHLKTGIADSQAEQIARDLKAIRIKKEGGDILVNSSAVKTMDAAFEKYVSESFVFENDMQLSSKQYLKTKRSIKINDIEIGGDTNNTLMIAGPCSVESEAQITESAEFLKSLGIKALRAGSFKPRTSPYSFQGLGLEGLKMLDKMREKYGFIIVTEVRDATHVEDVIAFADIVQIGAKSMYDHGILRRCGKARKPILFKRGFGTTLQEFVQASEFILSGGNEQVILCERGIRTFETKTRFTLDLCGAAYLKEYTNLPIILDPSHAIGYAYGVPDLSRACTAFGADGLLIEVHPNPKVAKSDASQQLNHPQFEDLLKSLKMIAEAVGRKLI